MGESINIREYLDIFKKRKKVVFLILFIFILGGGLLQYRHSKSYVPTYSSTVSVRINTNKKVETSTSNKKKSKEKEKEEKAQTQAQTPQDYGNSSLQSSSLNQSIAEKYSSLAVSKRAMMELKDKLRLKGSTESISRSISVVPQESIMEFIDIRVTNEDAKLGQKIASVMPEIFNNELKRVIGLDCVEVLYDATEPMINQKPQDNSLRNFTIIGIVLAIFVVLLLECLDNKIVTPDDAEKYWAVPVIGIVPFEKENIKGKKLRTEEVQA